MEGIMKLNVATITYFGKPRKVICDRNCGKAWGINSRPKVQLSNDSDDFAFLADGETGDAPEDPGTYEGEHAKPLSPDEFPNKWCVRECERCTKADVGKPIELRSFARRRFNLPSSDPGF
jgi:hypothetical protein